MLLEDVAKICKYTLVFWELLSSCGMLKYTAEVKYLVWSNYSPSTTAQKQALL